VPTILGRADWAATLPGWSTRPSTKVQPKCLLVPHHPKTPFRSLWVLPWRELVVC
jgi:hypothetical protein